MSNINKVVAAEIITQLKGATLISNDEILIENQIAEGAIKENEWKLVFERQIRNLEKQAESETE